MAVMVNEIDTHAESLAKLCEQYYVQRLELFGSAASGRFNSQSSDVDIVEAQTIRNPYFLASIQNSPRIVIYGSENESLFA
jgi:predicted nucleotidyltransferase